MKDSLNNLSNVDCDSARHAVVTMWLCMACSLFSKDRDGAAHTKLRGAHSGDHQRRVRIAEIMVEATTDSVEPCQQLFPQEREKNR